jgi:serine/threonine-protein kinase
MTVKLTDFGIARAAEQTRLTQVGSVVGTAAYLAPEQARGEEAGPASDVFALGVVIYQLLTARLPWEGSTLAELAIRRENERPLPPTSYDRAVPETLSRAVLSALEGDPAARYSSARQFSAALRAGLAGEAPPEPADQAPTEFLGATEATRRLPATEPETPVTPATRVPPARPAPPRRPVISPVEARPRRSLLSRMGGAIGMLLVIALLAAVIAGIVLLTTGQGSDVGVDVKNNVDEHIQSIRDFLSEHTQ